MGINLSDLNSRQLGLLSSEDRKLLGVQTNEEAGEKAARGREKVEHDLVIADCNRKGIPFIHAPCHRRVHDLPPGWPDFTFFANGRALFIEMKVEGGRLSKDQIAMHAILTRDGNAIHVTGSAQGTIALIKDWLLAV